MSTEAMIILGLVAIVLVYFITIYNNLVSLKNNVKKNWSDIDVLLKQRNSELPKLIDACKQYMQYEQSTLIAIVNARQTSVAAHEKSDMAAIGVAETTLRLGLGKLFALAENYPELKANQSYQQLQTRISSLEDDISDRREIYNASVNFNNTRIEQFPDLIVAKLLSFKALALLTFSSEETKDIDINKKFNA